MSWGPVLLVIASLAVVWPRGPVRVRPLPAVRVGGWLRRLRSAAGARPRRALPAAIGAAAAAGLMTGGPVAGVVAAAYAGLGGRALVRRAERRRAAVERAASLDSLAALAADLRAGLPPVAASSQPITTGGVARRLRRLTASVWRLAEQTGAPAADLVERIEADARAADRAGASAAAQAAGAQATAMLLAALPLGGLALGVLIGADPVEVLLRTPLGAACAIGAVVLQSAGLLWAERLAGGVAR